MAYLTYQQLAALFDLPVALPVTDLAPQDWLVVSTIQLAGSQAFSLSWLQLHLIASVDPSAGPDGTVTAVPNSAGVCTYPDQTPVLVTPGLGLAYVALYRDFNDLTQPSFQPAQEPPVFIGETAVAPTSSVRTGAPVTYASNGTYSFVVVNNTTNRRLRLVVNGTARVTLAASAPA